MHGDWTIPASTVCEKGGTEKRETEDTAVSQPLSSPAPPLPKTAEARSQPRPDPHLRQRTRLQAMRVEVAREEVDRAQVRG